MTGNGKSELPTLASAAHAIVAASEPAEKVRLSHATARQWFAGTLARVRPAMDPAMPDRPGRPEKPELMAPGKMPRRSIGGTTGRISMIHALTHIELNAIDLAWDIVGRFSRQKLPRSFFDDWVRVGLEEAKHFTLLERRLTALGSHYGALPAHDGLWLAARETGYALTARLALIPLVFEARGLDITPGLIAKAAQAGDRETADALEIIYRDEKFHVASGAKWFRFLCDRDGLQPEKTFQELVRRHFRGALKPPFNSRARAAAGLTPGFYKSLVARSR